MLKINKLAASYTKNNPILKGINLEVNEGEAVAVLGKNGCGKSTLAKAIFNLIPFIEGEITFSGLDITRFSTHNISKQGIGFFFQGGRVFPNLTVEENLIFAMQNKRNEKAKRIKEIVEYFELLKSNHRMNLKASYLSGGEKHQLALAMVLMPRPRFLILDELSAGLSPMNIKTIYEVLQQVKKDENLGLLLIEQNVSVAIENSDRVVLMQSGVIARATLCSNLTTPEEQSEFLNFNIN
ncbi:MAG: ABC transporter ATP-binding protein [Bacteroidales bacterium]